MAKENNIIDNFQVLYYLLQGSGLKLVPSSNKCPPLLWAPSPVSFVPLNADFIINIIIPVSELKQNRQYKNTTVLGWNDGNNW